MECSKCKFAAMLFLPVLTVIFSGCKSAGSQSSAAKGPIMVHDDGNMKVHVGASREVMSGLQPFLYNSSDGDLLVQSQLSTRPKGNRNRINHYSWLHGAKVSHDFGEHWEDIDITPNIDPPFFEGGGTQLRDGRLFILDTYLTPTDNHNEGEGDAWISRDGWRTLKRTSIKFHNVSSVDFNSTKDDGGRSHRALRLHRSVLELPGGDLLLTAYGRFHGENIPCTYEPRMMKQRSVLFRSRDGGINWDFDSTIAVGDVGTEGFVEPVLCRLSQGPHAGRLICLMRTGRHMYKAVSDDEGKTWSEAKAVMVPGVDIYDVARWKKYLNANHPRFKKYSVSPTAEGAMTDPDLLELKNGILVCAVGGRIPEKAAFIDPNCPQNGNYLLFSCDGGETWSNVLQLTSGILTTHYMAIREIRPNQLYVTYDLGVWGRPDNKVMGCKVEVSHAIKTIKPQSQHFQKNKELQ